MNQFTASVNMFVDSSQKCHVLEELSKIDAIKEVYEVAGEYDVVSIISTPGLEEFRELMHKEILHIKGVKGTITTVILKRNVANQANPEMVAPTICQPTKRSTNKR